MGAGFASAGSRGINGANRHTLTAGHDFDLHFFGARPDLLGGDLDLIAVGGFRFNGAIYVLDLNHLVGSEFARPAELTALALGVSR